jgi:hypothetical protein
MAVSILYIHKYNQSETTPPFKRVIYSDSIAIYGFCQKKKKLYMAMCIPIFWLYINMVSHRRRGIEMEEQKRNS